MKKRLPKVLLVLALVCVLAIGAAVATFADTAGNTSVTGDGEWYYSITVGGATETDADDYVEFYVELCDENGDWFTTTSLGYYWTWDDDNTLSYDYIWGRGGNWVQVGDGDEVIVEITRKDGDIAVDYFVNGVWSYSACCENVSFTDTVTWQVNILGGDVTASDLTEGHPVREAKAITDVKVSELSQTEFTVGSNLELEGTVLTVTYADGSSEEVTVNNGWTEDSYGNYIEVYIENESDTVMGYNMISEAGTYNVMVEFIQYNLIDQWNTEYDYADTGETITVKGLTVDDIDSDSLITLELDATVEGAADQWYVYTPSESGEYVFRIGEGGSYADAYMVENYVFLYVENEDGTLSVCDYDMYDSAGKTFRCDLEDGTTYYYRTMSLYDSESEYEVTLFKAKTVESFVVDSLGQTEFTQYISAIDLSGSVLTVTYTDGTTETVTIAESYTTRDVYGNRFYYRVGSYNEETEEWDYGYSYQDGIDEPGTYTVTFFTYVGEETITDTTLSITVVSIEDSSEITEILLIDETYTAEIEKTKSVWYSYTPVKTSTYIFTSSYDGDDYIDPWVRLYYMGEDGLEQLAYDDDSNGNYNFKLTYELEAGTTYYFQVRTYDGAAATVYVVLTEEDHEHTYDNAEENIAWEWAEDYSSATATLRCDLCSYSQTVTATVTSVTTAATTEAEGSIVYTATAVINGKTYVSDPKTVILEKLAESETPTEAPTETPTEAPTETPTEAPTETPTEAPTEAPTDGTATPTNATPSGQLSPAEGDVSVWGYVAILLGAAAAAVVLAKKKANA